MHEDVLPAGVYNFRVSGQVCHRIGHIQPSRPADQPKFAQLYIHDTENEIQDRVHWHSHLNFNEDTLLKISAILHIVSPFVKSYKHATAMIEETGQRANEIKLVLRAETSKDRRRYNFPTGSEIAVVFSDTPHTFNSKDTVLYCRTEDHLNGILYSE